MWKKLQNSLKIHKIILDWVEKYFMCLDKKSQCHGNSGFSQVNFMNLTDLSKICQPPLGVASADLASPKVPSVPRGQLTSNVWTEVVHSPASLPQYGHPISRSPCRLIRDSCCHPNTLNYPFCPVLLPPLPNGYGSQERSPTNPLHENWCFWISFSENRT